MVELLITLALIVLVSTLIMINISFFNRSFMRLELNKLYSVCMYLRQVALTTGKQQVITFDTANNSYYFNERKETLAQPLIFGVIKGVCGPPSAPSKPIKKAVTFVNNKIIFSPDGAISAGAVYLNDASTNNLYAISSSVGHIPYFKKYVYTDAWVVIS